MRDVGFKADVALAAAHAATEAAYQRLKTVETSLNGMQNIADVGLQCVATLYDLRRRLNNLEAAVEAAMEARQTDEARRHISNAEFNSLQRRFQTMESWVLKCMHLLIPEEEHTYSISKPRISADQGIAHDGEVGCTTLQSASSTIRHFHSSPAFFTSSSSNRSLQYTGNECVDESNITHNSIMLTNITPTSLQENGENPVFAVSLKSPDSEKTIRINNIQRTSDITKTTCCLDTPQDNENFNSSTLYTRLPLGPGNKKCTESVTLPSIEMVEPYFISSTNFPLNSSHNIKTLPNASADIQTSNTISEKKSPQHQGKWNSNLNVPNASSDKTKEILQQLRDQYPSTANIPKTPETLLPHYITYDDISPKETSYLEREFNISPTITHSSDITHRNERPFHQLSDEFHHSSVLYSAQQLAKRLQPLSTDSFTVFSNETINGSFKDSLPIPIPDPSPSHENISLDKFEFVHNTLSSQDHLQHSFSSAHSEEKVTKMSISSKSQDERPPLPLKKSKLLSSATFSGSTSSATHKAMTKKYQIQERPSSMVTTMPSNIHNTIEATDNSFTHKLPDLTSGSKQFFQLPIKLPPHTTQPIPSSQPTTLSTEITSLQETPNFVHTSTYADTIQVPIKPDGSTPPALPPRPHNVKKASGPVHDKVSGDCVEESTNPIPHHYPPFHSFPKPAHGADGDHHVTASITPETETVPEPIYDYISEAKLVADLREMEHSVREGEEEDSPPPPPLPPRMAVLPTVDVSTRESCSSKDTKRQNAKTSAMRRGTHSSQQKTSYSNIIINKILSNWNPV